MNKSFKMLLIGTMTLSIGLIGVKAGALTIDSSNDVDDYTITIPSSTTTANVPSIEAFTLASSASASADTYTPASSGSLTASVTNGTYNYLNVYNGNTAGNSNGSATISLPNYVVDSRAPANLTGWSVSYTPNLAFTASGTALTLQGNLGLSAQETAGSANLPLASSPTATALTATPITNGSTIQVAQAYAPNATLPSGGTAGQYNGAGITSLPGTIVVTAPAGQSNTISGTITETLSPTVF